MSAASAQFALACLFCGGPHVTKTHVYARSYTQMFDDSDREYLVRHERTDPATGQTTLLKRAGTFAHKPLAACQACNGGWMREMEDAVRPVLKGFAVGRFMLLDQREQEKLALWTVTAHSCTFSWSPRSTGSPPDPPRELTRRDGLVRRALSDRGGSSGRLPVLGVRH